MNKCKQPNCQFKIFFNGNQTKSDISVIEAVVQRCSVKKVFLEISQNSQENTCEFCEISKNTFFHRPLLVAASGFIEKRNFFILHCKTFKNDFFLRITFINANELKK